jgi:outer membrane protein OmpA-like peptidoglycan-associated protein
MAIEPDGNRTPGTPGGTHGSSHIDEVGATKKTNWLPLILGALALLALLFALTRCNRDNNAVPVDNTVVENSVNDNAMGNDVSGTTAAAGTPAAAAAATGDVLADMRTYYGSSEAAGRRFNFDNIEFASGSAVVPASAKTTVDGLAALLKANSKSAIRIEGYADAKGAAGANKNLGAQRANAVKQALAAGGIMTGRITTATGGESNPVDSNATSGGRAQNRRTDVVVTTK